MGKIGDVSGKVGDVSGLGVEGKVGDVSGAATFDDVQRLLFEDRRNEGLGCLERKVDRLQFEVLALARWLDLRIRAIESKIETHTTDIDNIRDNIEKLEGKVSRHDESLEDHGRRIWYLEHPCPYPHENPSTSPPE